MIGCHRKWDKIDFEVDITTGGFWIGFEIPEENRIAEIFKPGLGRICESMGQSEGRRVSSLKKSEKFLWK